MNIVGFVFLPSIMDHVIQSFTQPPPSCQDLILSQSHLAPRETVIPPHQFPCPRETIVQNTDILFTPIFLVYPNQRNKSKGSCQMKNPIRGTMSSVGVSGPRPPVSMTRLWSRESPRSGADSVFLWWHLASYCPLFTIYHGYGISIFLSNKD